MFNIDSGLVKLWVDAIKNEGYNIEQVPAISNLRDVVGSLI